MRRAPVGVRWGALVLVLFAAPLLVGCDLRPKPAVAPSGCKEEATFGSFVSFFCPSATDPVALGRFLGAIAKERAAASKTGQVHVLVARQPGGVARNASQIDYEAPATLATVDWNNNTRFYKMTCRRAGGLLEDCTALLQP